jgi:hypothetical protein
MTTNDRVARRQTHLKTADAIDFDCALADYAAGGDAEEPPTGRWPGTTALGQAARSATSTNLSELELLGASS